MNNIINRVERKRILSINYLTPGVLVLLMIGLISCSTNEIDNSNLGNQRHLIAELERNQLIWSQSGVSDYSFSLTKECTDCPADVETQQAITVKSGVVSSKSGGIGARSISARDDDDDNRRSTQGTQSVRVESLFTDLRQAILQNAVQQVRFDPVFGFPQFVQVNNGNIQARSFDDDDLRQNVISGFDDDDFRQNIVPNVSFQTSGFQVLGTNNVTQNITSSGQFIRQDNPFANAPAQYWLIDNNGQWKQLNISANVFQTVNSIPNKSFVQVTGQWLPGGVSGQGQINVQQITANQARQNAVQNNLTGSLFYSVLNNSSFDLDDFYVTSDRGNNVFLNLPNNLQNQAFQLAGQRVNLNGSWTPFAGAPNARFIPNGLSASSTVNTVLESFSGILAQGSTYQIPGLQQSNFILIDDFGGVMELQVPVNISNTLSMSIGQRVTVQGTRINAGAFGQSVIYVQSANQQQNIFTNTQISGVISAVLPADIYGTMESVLLNMDNGSMVTLQIPSIYRDPYNALTIGMRVQANGAWITNAAFGQGKFEARSPVQITNMGVTANNTYSGYISNVGSFSNGANCNATQTNYTFITDNGQQFQLYVANTTIINGLNTQGTNIPYQSRVQVSGVQISPGVLQAQTINVTPQFETTISGTIVDIGAAGSTFTCTGALNTYRLLDTFGNAYSITTTANSLIQGNLGSFLRIGDVVSATGSMSTNGTTFNASKVIATSAAYSYTPLPGTQFSPIPNNTTNTFVGTITGLDCARNATDVYNFVDQSGMLYALSVNQNVSPGLFIDVGTQLQVTGSLMNNTITAQQVASLQTFANPLNRTPISGSIISVAGSLPTSCNTPVYTYQFQNDNGQMQQVRMTSAAALHLPQPIGNGTRITIVSSVQSNNPQLIDALEIQYQNAGFQSNGQTFGFNTGGGQNISVLGTIVTTLCNNEYYFVDQNGRSYQLQLNASIPNIGTGVGTKLNVTGQVIGNKLVASSAFADTSAIYMPIQAQLNGTIQGLVNTETLNCGVTVSTYTFQNDTGVVQRLRVASSNMSFAVPGVSLTAGSRVFITNKIQSFDGSVVDALNISQQLF